MWALSNLEKGNLRTSLSPSICNGMTSMDLTHPALAPYGAYTFQTKRAIQDSCKAISKSDDYGKVTSRPKAVTYHLPGCLS